MKRQGTELFKGKVSKLSFVLTYYKYVCSIVPYFWNGLMIIMY